MVDLNYEILWNNAVQNMQYENGVQKGIKTILEERGCWELGMKLADAKKLLSSHTDFAASKEWLQEIADSHEVLINYFPKFHCELNFIEMVWCFTKCHLRRD